LRPCLRRLKQAVLGSSALSYEERAQAEIRNFTALASAQSLPPISHYWSNTHLVPMIEPLGFRNSLEMFRQHIAGVCARQPRQTCRVLSLAAGDSASEINMAQWLIENNVRNFLIECCDFNEEVLSRGRRAAAEKGFGDYFEFTVADVNAWEPRHRYQIILAIQCLHHVVKLERLFDSILGALDPSGFFMTDDMIGRNGHQRWPEALAHVLRFWDELPVSHKSNHVFRTVDVQYENRDFSIGCFEGIRSQDILPLLVKRFHFDVFAGFGNVIDAFIDGMYGPNFDPDNSSDRQFIDRVHALDVQEMDAGRLKPTHMYAAMMKTPVDNPRFSRHWSPEFCVRMP